MDLRLFVFFVVLVVAFQCKVDHSDLVREKSPDQLQNEVRSFLTAYFADIAKEGLTAEFKYLDSSEQFFWVPPGFQSALTYDSVRTILESNAGKMSEIRFSWDQLTINMLHDTIANYTGIIKGHMVDTSGTQSQVVMIETGIVIKRSDGWKILSGQSRNIE